MSEYKQLDYDEWYEEYDVVDEVLESDPAGKDAKYVWTEIESDGYFSWEAGRHYVNRTGRYMVSRKPHDFDAGVPD